MKRDRPRWGGEQRKEYFGMTSLSYFRGKKKKKKNEKSAAQLHTESSEIKHSVFTSPKASEVQLWVSVVIHVEKTITRQVPCAGLLFPPAFALLQWNCGDLVISFSRRKWAALSS